MITKRFFDKTRDGKDVFAYKISNAKGEYAEIIEFGAIIHKICVLDGSGLYKDVALGYETVEEYRTSGTHYGALIGRVANRIAGPSFVLNGKKYELNDNTGAGVQLHGGFVGFDRQLFTATVDENDPSSVTFSLFSPDGDEFYPGNLIVSCRYTFTDDSNLILDYNALSDRDTVLALTNHSYFNLDGQDCGKNIEDTMIQINGKYTTPLGTDFCPTGEFADVTGTAYDFSEFKKLGRDIRCGDPQLELAGGYDINYCINYDKLDNPTQAKPVPEAMRDVPVVKDLPVVSYAYSETSKIAMATQSALPCVQFYVGNFIEPSDGKNGAKYDFRSGFCFETQTFPNAMNTEAFPDVVLKGGQPYSSRTVYTFGIAKKFRPEEF